jgi:hypothetical protein
LQVGKNLNVTTNFNHLGGGGGGGGGINEMKTTPLTTSFPKSKGKDIEIDQFVNPKNQGKF